MDKVIFKPVHQLEEDFYIQLKNECFQLIEKLNWNNGLNQIMLQTHDPNVDDYMNGAGRIADALYTDETMYKYIQPSLKGTNIEKFLIDNNVFRSRLMLVNPKKCYSVHKDPSARLHLALQTNDQAFFMFPYRNKFHTVRENRTTYYVNTMEYHSFANCGTEDRIHLVMCTKDVY